MGRYRKEYETEIGESCLVPPLLQPSCNCHFLMSRIMSNSDIPTGHHGRLRSQRGAGDDTRVG